jgi:hypothetical protein
MRMMSLVLATMFSVTLAANAHAQLRHVELKTLGMD